MLLDIVNGCHFAHTGDLSKSVAGDFQLEENVKSEDLLNNNQGALEQDCLTNQRFVVSGDFTAVGDQISVADNPILKSSKGRNSAEYKETFNHLHDSCQTSDKGKEQDGKELYSVQSKGALSNYTLKNNISKDISGNKEISQGELQNVLDNPCKMNLIKLQDDEESCARVSILGDRSNDKEHLEIINFTETDSDMLKRDFLDEVMKQNINSSTESIDHKPEDCDEPILAENNVNHHAVHLKTNKCDISSTNEKAATSMEHCDVLESEGNIKNSLDFQTKRLGLCLPKNNGTRRGKRKKEHRSLKCGRLQPVLHELEFVEEEDPSEKEESSEEENIDNSFHYSCSKDGLDHRKERHQYVSDKLDPDVLHLLEMHLRKQQLVDIKEEGEEEIVDVHINKEISRSDSYKLLRNIPPVLDMVLEEPELEHAGDLLEEDSKTPSDIDSDDSGNVYFVETGLMESLKYDLMSKSSKIDQHEIETILQGPSKGHKSKQNEGAMCPTECETKPGNIQNSEPKEREAQMRDPSDLQIIHKDDPEDVGSALGSEDADDTEEDIVDDSSHSFSDSHKTEQSLALNERDSALTETESSQVDQISESPTLDLASDVSQQKVSDVDETKLHDSSSLNDSDIALADSTNSENASGLPCPTYDGTPCEPCLESKIISEEKDSCSPCDGGDFRLPNDSSEQTDDVGKGLSNHEINLTDVNKDLVIKANVKPPTDPTLSEELLSNTADMNTLHEDLKQKISSLLEKAHAADCRSSRLQAEAELLFKESIELRNECKSLSKEAAELLSIFTQQEVLHRHQERQLPPEAEAEGSFYTSKAKDEETLGAVSKRTAKQKKKKKAESQLQILSKKYSFLRQEGPEIMRDLHVLQQDLKNLTPHHSKPIGFLYKWLWGGLIAGGTMLLVWWSTKQLG